MKWDPRDRAFIRKYYGKMSAKDIADAVERTIDQVRGLAKQLGLTRKMSSRRPWSQEELDFVRTHHATMNAWYIAGFLGRTLRMVYNANHKLGLVKWPRWPQEILDQVTKLHRQGLPTRAVADRVGLSYDQVKQIRYRLGLPTNVDTEAKKRAVVNQLKTLGLSSPTELRSRAFRLYAIECGWPEDLRPREVQILNVLAARGVPMTRLEIAQAIGMRTDRTGDRGHGHKTLELLSGNGPGGTYTASLMRRGLVAKLKRGSVVAGLGKGHSRDLYYLGPEAVRILEARACQQQQQSEMAS